MDLGKIDWNALKRYLNPQSLNDMDGFLDALPVNVGYNALIAAGMAWIIAGASIFFASSAAEEVNKLHADLVEVQAQQPPIPTLKYTSVNRTVLKTVSDRISLTYKGVAIVVNGDGDVTISAQDTDYFPQFLAAVSHLQRGDKNWKVRIDSLCVGRGCPGSKLSGHFKVESVRIGEAAGGGAG